MLYTIRHRHGHILFWDHEEIKGAISLVILRYVIRIDPFDLYSCAVVLGIACEICHEEPPTPTLPT